MTEKMHAPVMDSIDSLTKTFGNVPPTAVPAILDCISNSTGLSLNYLFDSLLDAFSNFTKDILDKGHEKLDSVQSSYIVSFTTALCYLLKKFGTNHSALESFIWRGFIPTMKITSANAHELRNQIAEQLCDVVIKTNSWDIIEMTLVPLSLRSVGLSIGMLQNGESAIYEWSRYSVIQGTNDRPSDSDIDKESIPPLSVSFPLAISCHILTSLLIASLRSHQVEQSPLKPIVVNGCCAENFARNLLWDLFDMAVRMLSQCPEHRSCTIRLLLPFIFRACFSHSLQISVHGQTCVLSREYFFEKIWECCRSLFSLGPLERKDAYNVLSLYLSFFFHKEGCEDVAASNGVEEFDLRAEQEFWDEIRRGLVDKEGLVRKQSLYILKMSLQSKDGRECYNDASESILCKKSSTSCGMTKREQWAEMEAKSLGVGEICDLADPCLSSQQRWEAFLLLYEMLEEYGTHLVEAAWNHQISLLLHLSFPQDTSFNPINGGVYQIQMGTLKGIISWLAVLWERGLCHENPQVRCLIMESFLSIDWKNHGNCAKLVPESFILGPFIQGLNDTVHHRYFGVKGVYSSKTIECATDFLYQFCSHFSERERVTFLCSLASVVGQEPFGRAGLMALSVCIASVACAAVQCCEVGSCNMVQVESSEGSFYPNNKADLLDILRLVIESSKQHFNPNYRLRVCENVLEAAASVMCTSDVPLETLMHFFSAVPREFTDCGGSLRGKVQEWFSECSKKKWTSNSSSSKTHVLNCLFNFPKRFIGHHQLPDVFVTYDDEDLNAWGFEAQRWARVLFLVITEEHQLESIFKFLLNYGINIGRQNNHLEWIPPKFLILAISLVQELQIIQEKSPDCAMKVRKMEVGVPDSDRFSSTEVSIIFEKFSSTFLFILEELVLFAKSACSIFWSSPVVVEAVLPCSVRGKLGGPSQRRLACGTTTAVLQAMLSMKTVAYISSWCAQFKTDGSLDFAFTFLWSFSRKVIFSPTCESESGAEIHLAAYEALVPILKALASAISPVVVNLIMADDNSVLPTVEDRPLLDPLVLGFLQNINDLLAVGVLARSRRAVLMNWKWLCLDSLLSIPYCTIENGVHLGGPSAFFSGAAIKCIFADLVESLENAGETSVLPILRSVRLVLGFFPSGRMGSIVSSCDGVDTKMMLQLVHSSWILHVSCNKRRVASIAALLSSILHSSVFGDERMHATTDSCQGPLKWFVETILHEGTKSPRTIRLAALHLTGSWLLNPRIIKYYIRELKQLSLYGSVAFDEDFEAELAESHDARTEVSLLGKSPDFELTEAFINTELYARVSVAVLFYKLADLSDKLGSLKENEDRYAAFHSGKSFLLELLDSVVNDKDLAKELYKKYSGIHRRKVRAWQMICILSRFVDEDIVQQVTSSLHICLYRNNLPAVRQYLEIFAIQIYLKFPSLVEDQLCPIFRNYNMRPQALSSYVFIAANVILHATDELVRFRHLDELLPPIIPLLTSHHHSLRGFTQLLVYQVLYKMAPARHSNGSEVVPLEKRCLMDLKSYLEKNSDCVRLRASMERFLDAFDPKSSASPAGIFTARDEGLEFECVPTSLMEQVITFLNDAREDLRHSMAKDAVTINNESLTIGENFNGIEVSLMADQEKLSSMVPKDLSLDFQKKVTLSKHERQDGDAISFLANIEPSKLLVEMEKEDHLLNQVLQSRSMAMEMIRSSRQHFILVASLLDRIPNLAGLARTCEVFKASGLAIADANIVHDKQFQLISVTAEKWVPIIEVPVRSVKVFLEKKKREGFSILGLEQTANSIPLDEYTFPKKTVLVLGREKEGIPVDIIHVLDACIEIPQLGVVRSLNVHVSGAIALWEYTRQQRSQKYQLS